MAKLSLKADPTFEAKVLVPLAGGKTVDVNMTFKHRTRQQLVEFFNEMTLPTDETTADPNLALDRDVDLVMKCVSSWNLEDEFTRDNVKELLDNYAGTATAIYQTYVNALRGARVGN